MQRIVLFSAVACLLFPAALAAQASDAEYIRLAEQGGPASIASKAAVVRVDPDGKVTPLRKGSNQFTCTVIPDGSDAPYCADEAGHAWMVAAISKQPKPPLTQAGVAYMAKGGMHHETPDGEIVLEPAANTKAVKEPPHWMLLWPLDPATTGLPTTPGPGGSYIMFAGTPYAHLMVYQDPAKLVK